MGNQIYAKYNYQFIFDAFSLTRDNTEIVYQIEKSVPDNQYTNKDIILKIISNKIIENVEGFELDKSRTTLSKNISENENRSLILEDLSGNKKEVNYSISNIDKEPPQINGIENGIIYKQAKSIEYTDNIGVKDIKVDKYGDSLIVRCVEDYYDTGDFRGLNILGNQIFVNVRQHPRGTVAYKYYLNNVLKATTDSVEYTYKGLSNGTNYTFKVEAIDKNGNVIQTVSRTVKTKYFEEIFTVKEGDNFYVTLTGIDSKMKVGYCALWHEDYDTRKFTYPKIGSNRQINLSFNAYDVNGVKSSGYYYFHLQLVNTSNPNLNEVICMNIKFDGRIYVLDTVEKINPTYLTNNGGYDITVTDLAGNITTKNCIIAR